MHASLKYKSTAAGTCGQVIITLSVFPPLAFFPSFKVTLFGLYGGKRIPKPVPCSWTCWSGNDEDSRGDYGHTAVRNTLAGSVGLLVSLEHLVTTDLF